MHYITIKGKKRELRYDLNALVHLDEECGINVFDSEAFKVSPGCVTSLLWAGLLHEEPKLTREELTASVDLRDLPELHKVAMAALVDALPLPKRDDSKTG